MVALVPSESEATLTLSTGKDVGTEVGASIVSVDLACTGSIEAEIV